MDKPAPDRAKFCQSAKLVLKIKQRPVNQVSLHNMMHNFLHEFNIIFVPRREGTHDRQDPFTMDLTANIGGGVGPMVTLSVLF